MMEATKIHEYARALKESHGNKALQEAAQKAAAYERDGNSEQAKIWRSVEAALKEMAGPHAS